MDYIVSLIIFIALVAVGYFVGTRQEKKHYQSIREREELLKGIVVIASRNPPDYNQRPYRTEFVCGSVVVAMDYFKKQAGSLVSLFGGRIRFYETLVERGRREAVLRMKADADAKRAQMVFNVKFSTASILKDKAGQPGGSVEVTAYGTAIIYGR
ncbi:YbjQ family protein [Deltaproteobacteria bacterium OttesenSCG-928-M10]|nr:YbjQ family protein [Deltaproteobacteria bacterium OttesenSCG-928-M10]